MDTLQTVMRNYPQGVSVVTTDGGDGPRGITVSSLISISLSPPLVLVSISQASESHDPIRHAGAFSVNVLSEDQGSVSEHFARSGLTPDEQFKSIPFERAPNGAPRLEGCLAYLDCRIVNTISQADHTLFVGEVEHVALGPQDARPLLFYGRHYWSLGETVFRRGQLADGKPSGQNVILR